MMLTMTFTPEEVEALLDALAKGASRHEAYAKFHRTSDRASRKHARAASQMRGMARRLVVYRDNP